MSLEEKPTLFLEFHSSEAGLDEQTNLVADIARDNGGSDFQFAKQVRRRSLLLFLLALNQISAQFLLCSFVTTEP